MKKVLVLLALLSMTCGATEILSEYYVMEKVLPLLTEAESYVVNGQEVKAIKVDNKIFIKKRAKKLLPLLYRFNCVNSLYFKTVVSFKILVLEVSYKLLLTKLLKQFQLLKEN